MLKCPSHALNVHILAKVIPEANIVFTHRDPKTLPASSGSLIARLHAASVSKNDWWRTIEANAQMHFNSSKSMAQFDARARADDSRKIFHSAYSRLVTNPVELIREIHEFFGLAFSDVHEQNMKSYLAKNGQHSHGKHHYSNKYLGLQLEFLKEGFNEYLDYFAEHLPKDARLLKVIPEPSICDVIAVGRDVSGLAAAQPALDRTNDKSKVTVLEARDRVLGGRLMTHAHKLSFLKDPSKAKH